ncbi:MAG: YcgL domain-containing protein [Rhodanobacter sp.]|nr:MAG: YcgL domain-containing protein [Rhodanobacter sp.]
MQCFVYASQRRSGSYLWLARKDDFEVLSEPLKNLLGELRPVLEVELDPQRKLPAEDAATVLEHLHAQGWHLQLPPTDALAGDRLLDYGQHPTA